MQDEMIIQKNEMNANVKGGGLHYSNIIKKAFGEDVLSKYSFLIWFSVYLCLNLVKPK